MKIRNGFVSNSSSSSFVLLVDKQSALDILSQIDSEVKDEVLKLCELFNENTLVFLGWDNDCGHWLDRKSEDVRDCFHDFSCIVKRLPRNKCLYESRSY